MLMELQDGQEGVASDMMMKEHNKRHNSALVKDDILSLMKISFALSSLLAACMNRGRINNVMSRSFAKHKLNLPE